jgi:hypothetical protein
MLMISAKSRTEIKVRAASLAVFAVTTVGGILLETSVTDWAKDLPPWLQVPAASLILAGVTWLAGRRAKSRPDYLSPSTIEAAEVWTRQHAPRIPREGRFN